MLKVHSKAGTLVRVEQDGDPVVAPPDADNTILLDEAANATLAMNLTSGNWSAFRVQGGKLQQNGGGTWQDVAIAAPGQAHQDRQAINAALGRLQGGTHTAADVAVIMRVMARKAGLL